MLLSACIAVFTSSTVFTKRRFPPTEQALSILLQRCGVDVSLFGKGTYKAHVRRLKRMTKVLDLFIFTMWN